MTPSASIAITPDRLSRAVPLLPLKRRKSARYAGREEPTLAELMGDPILDRLLASDGLRHEHLRAVIAEARARLGRS